MEIVVVVVVEIMGWKGMFAHAHSQLIVIRHWDFGWNHFVRRFANAERFHQFVDLELWLWLLRLFPLRLFPLEGDGVFH